MVPLEIISYPQFLEKAMVCEGWNSLRSWGYRDCYFIEECVSLYVIVGQSIDALRTTLSP